MNTKPLYELLQPGMVAGLGSHTFEAEEIIAFGSKFDPQPFHLSEELAAGSIFDRLCASGWHTGATFMRKNIENCRKEFIRLTGYSGPPSEFGPSPGLRNLRWHLPVYVDDTISYKLTVAGKRPSPNNPGWGILMNNSRGYNQDGTLVFAVDGAEMLRME